MTSSFAIQIKTQNVRIYFGWNGVMRDFYCQSDPSTKNEEDENFRSVDKVTDRSKCELKILDCWF